MMSVMIMNFFLTTAEYIDARFFKKCRSNYNCSEKKIYVDLSTNNDTIAEVFVVYRLPL